MAREVTLQTADENASIAFGKAVVTFGKIIVMITGLLSTKLVSK